MNITNVSKANRGIHDDRGRLVMLAPGQSVEISVSEKAEKLLRKKTCFKLESLDIVGNVKPDLIIAAEVKPDDDDVVQLRSDAESLGIKVDNRWGEKRLQAEIDKALNAVHTTDSD